MKIRDLLLALIVVTLWGINFTVIKLGVSEMPPMLLASLRFTFAALPAITFIKRPQVGWKYIVAYGMTVGVGQFSCLFYAENIGMPAGVASVVLQAQAFFTIIFAGILFKESIRMSHIIGLCVAGIGLFFISGTVGVHGIPVGALLLTLLAALFWGTSNIIARKASKEAVLQGKNLNMLSMVVWSSLVPPLPLLGIAFLLDKPETLFHSITNLNALSVFSIFYLAFLATIIGYGIWSTLLAKYPAGKVAPLSMLVPIFGVITAQIVLKEQLYALQWLGGVIIISGLLISNFASSLKLHIFLKRKNHINL